MNEWFVIVVWHLGGRGGHDALSEAVGDLPRELVLSVRLLMPVHPAACFGINSGWPLLSLLKVLPVEAEVAGVAPRSLLFR